MSREIWANSRVRLLVEELGNQTWNEMGKFFENSMLNRLSYPQNTALSVDGIYLGKYIIYFVDSRINSIFTFNREGELIEEIKRKHFFDLAFRRNKRKILLKGDEQVLTKAEHLEALSMGIADYSKKNPEINLTLIDEIESSYEGLLDSERYFKAECYGRGADLILNYSNQDKTGFGYYEENFRGALYKKTKNLEEKTTN